MRPVRNRSSVFALLFFVAAACAPSRQAAPNVSHAPAAGVAAPPEITPPRAVGGGPAAVDTEPKREPTVEAAVDEPVEIAPVHIENERPESPAMTSRVLQSRLRAQMEAVRMRCPASPPGKPATGIVELHIGDEGHVDEAKLVSFDGPADIADCVQRAFRELEFPKQLAAIVPVGFSL
jgi:hypothetical protein